jgi:hypothetical protein
MIALFAAAAIGLAALQASIAAPTDAFRGCLREAVAKAKTEKVAGNAIEAYLKTACSAQMSTLKSAVVAFRMKNGMSKKAAADDADMTVDDYVSTPADNYKFMADMNAPKSAAPAAGATPPATPAAAPTQPPKP